MATGQAAEALPTALEQAIFPQSLDHVSATARLEAAYVAQEWAQRVLVDPDHADKERHHRPGHGVHVGGASLGGRGPRRRAASRARRTSDACTLENFGA